VRLGLRYAVDRGASRVVILDADGQHAPSDIAALLAALDAGADMVIGSRFVTGDGEYRMGGVRRRAHGFLNRVIRTVSGFEATDATSGFRAFERPVVELLAENYPVEYLADTVEVILLVRQQGFTVSEVQVGMLQRQGGVPSKTTFGLLFNYGRLLVGVLGAAVSGRAKRTPTNGATG
jgi:glycosyltransferase involved in cell wall biosynthesis